MNYLEDLTSNRAIFFNYMKEKYEVVFKSNIFLRDLQYAIKSYYEKKGHSLNYKQAEKLALEFSDKLVTLDELNPMKKNTWKVNFSFESGVKELAAEINS